jgi:hypothetical protein
MQLPSFITHYLWIVFGNARGIVLGVVGVLGWISTWFDKKPEIPRWARVWSLVAIVVVAQALAYKQLADNPPVVLKIPAPLAPTVAQEQPQKKPVSSAASVSSSRASGEHSTAVGSINQGAGSIAQVGGTGDIAIIGATEWNMPPEQQSTLIDSLKKVTGRIKVNPLFGDVGAQRYAGYLLYAFDKASWKIENKPSDAGFMCSSTGGGWDCYGIQIQIPAGDSQQARSVVAALSSLNPKVTPEPGYDNDFVQIDVGKHR